MLFRLWNVVGDDATIIGTIFIALCVIIASLLSASRYTPLNVPSTVTSTRP